MLVDGSDVSLTVFIQEYLGPQRSGQVKHGHQGPAAKKQIHRPVPFQHQHTQIVNQWREEGQEPGKPKDEAQNRVAHLAVKSRNPAIKSTKGPHPPPPKDDVGHILDLRGHFGNKDGQYQPNHPKVYQRIK